MTGSRSRLAQQRRKAGYSQEELAEALQVDRSTVHRWESGRVEPQPHVRSKLARLLRVTLDELEALVRSAKRDTVASATVQQSTGTRAEAPSSLADLRQAVVGGFVQADLPELSGTERAVQRAHQLYQHAEYDAAAKFLPHLIDHLDRAPTGEATARRRATAYVAAAKLATKLGDGALAWITADRAHRAAKEAGQPALIGLARYQVACALLRNRCVAEARAVTTEAAEDLLAAPSVVRPAAVSVRGALLLLGAILAAHEGKAAAARQLLRQAQALAESLGSDGNWLWTGFGPTNVAIHELSVDVRLGDTKRAYDNGTVIDTDSLPASLVGRRSQVHLDLSRAAADVHDGGLAVLHLLEAERVATQSVSRNVNAHQIISALLAHERRNAMPGLRALACRAGVLDA